MSAKGAHVPRRGSGACLLVRVYVMDKMPMFAARGKITAPDFKREPGAPDDRWIVSGWEVDSFVPRSVPESPPTQHQVGAGAELIGGSGMGWMRRHVRVV
ncbi:geranylgeranyl pyrophosphate synthetase [Marssonina coronariae]|uniref:Geranylgeranyl pyrophosphate synthetase n=1 Tax=Diplocarpon coronariae TaxID=2795749 RepID=A0A218Z182_9HELO|nr:geranylgeranyl pyrophosphate synthetase [Marssonina coronariae]